MLLGETAPSDPLAPLAGESALLLAVSGGPDSVALMLLAARWPRRAAGVKITVATVDTGCVKIRATRRCKSDDGPARSASITAC